MQVHGSTALWTWREIKERLGVEQEEDFEIADYEQPFVLNPDMPL